jgi:hypothetical protein
MDYLAKVMEDFVVNNPPSRSHISNAVSLSSPLKEKIRFGAQILNSAIDSRLIQKLYDSPTSSIQEALIKVYST